MCSTFNSLVGSSCPIRLHGLGPRFFTPRKRVQISHGTPTYVKRSVSKPGGCIGLKNRPMWFDSTTLHEDTRVLGSGRPLGLGPSFCRFDSCHPDRGRSQMVKAPDCGSGICGFEPHRSHKNDKLVIMDKVRIRFYAKVDRSSGPNACWPWRGAKDWDGYGKFNFQGKIRSAHSVSMHLKTGMTMESIGEGRHTCDTTDCCNPDHVIHGTHAQNMGDKKERNRVKRKFLSISTKQEVELDVANGCRDWKSLSIKYGVTPRRIRQIAQEVIGKKPARCLGQKVKPLLV